MYGCEIVWPAADRQRGVVVRAVAQLLGDEELPRHALHRGEHALVGDVAARAAASRPWRAARRPDASSGGTGGRRGLHAEVTGDARRDVHDAARAAGPRRRSASAPPSRRRAASRGSRRRRDGDRRCRRTPCPRPPRRALRRRSGSRAPPRRARSRSGRRAATRRRRSPSRRPRRAGNAAPRRAASERPRRRRRGRRPRPPPRRPSSRAASSRHVEAAVVEPVGHRDTVRRGQEHLGVVGRATRREQRHAVERALEPHAVMHRHLPVVGAEDHVVALEERVAAARRVEERAHGARRCAPARPAAPSGPCACEAKS